MAVHLIRRNGCTLQRTDLAHASRRYMGVHPAGDGISWDLCEEIDVDQPIGLAYRGLDHLAKAVRKRVGKEHETFGDDTAGGEHIPGYCQVLKHVDGTADVTGAADATLFQNSGIVHSAGHQTLWCITGAASDPTILLLDPDKQYKGGDITWTGAAQFDASVDMTIANIDASLTVKGAALLDGTTNIHGPCDMSNTNIDGTLTVLDRADFSTAGFAGDVTIAGNLQVDGTGAVFGGAAGLGLFYDPTVSAGGESLTLPNGVIIKMGTANSTLDTEETFTFAVAFPHACQNVQITQVVAHATIPLTLSEAPTVAGFKINRLDTLQGDLPFHWLAVGY